MLERLLPLLHIRSAMHLVHVTWFMLIVPTLLGCTYISTDTPRPSATQGVINLKDWDFKEGGPLRLDGNWAIYPNEFIEPKKAWSRWADNSELSARSYYRVPQIWNPILSPGAPQLTSTGFATYILEVQGLNQKDVAFALGLKCARSAYRLYIIPATNFAPKDTGNTGSNTATASKPAAKAAAKTKPITEAAPGQLYIPEVEPGLGQPLMANGVPGTSEQTELPQNLLHTKPFTPPGETFLILVHVSNFVMPVGGLRNPIWLGDVATLQSQERQHERLAFLVVGVLALLSIYHLILYGGRRTNGIHLLFATVCCLILIWYLLFERLIHKSIAEPTSFSFTLVDMIITWAYTLCFPLFYDFLRRLFPQQFPQKIVMVAWVATALNMLLRHLDYAGTYLVFALYNGFLTLVVGASLFFLFRAFKNKRTGAGESLIGFGFFAVAILNDVAKSHSLIHTPTLSPIGLIAFSIIHSFILTRRRNYGANPGATRLGGRYRRSYLKTADTDSLLHRLNELMNQEKLYRDEELDVRSLAKELDVSAHQLSELINAKLGTTFKGYVRSLRVAEAKQYLATASDDVSMETIAYSVGFRSISNFHRLFKQETGLTPKEYQKSMQAKT